MHAVAAECLQGSKTPWDFVGQWIPVNYKTEPERKVQFDDDMAELVEGYTLSLLAIAAGQPLLVEQRVDFSEFVDVPGQFGTLDAAVFFPDSSGNLGVTVALGHHIRKMVCSGDATNAAPAYAPCWALAPCWA
jgi:hypothetical protein